MMGILIGIIGFVSMLMFDVSTLFNKTISKYVFLTLAMLLMGSALALLWPYNNQFQNKFIFPPLLLTLIAFFSVLLIYSVVIEVRINSVVKGETTQLVTSGTYRLVRHPGVIWLFAVLLLTSLYLGNYYLLIASFAWTIVNAIYVSIQEKWVLNKLFDGYKVYQQETPMLIPTIKSFMAFTKQTMEE